MTTTIVERPIVATAFSFGGGVLILATSILHTWFGQMVGMWFTMGGMRNMMDIGPMVQGVSLIGVISGVLVLLATLMMYYHPAQSFKWGVVVIVFSMLSLFGLSGFMLGAFLGLIGGGLAVSFWISKA